MLLSEAQPSEELQPRVAPHSRSALAVKAEFSAEQQPRLEAAGRPRRQASQNAELVSRQRAWAPQVLAEPQEPRPSLLSPERLVLAA
jgi:hypothetical protein